MINVGKKNPSLRKYWISLKSLMAKGIANAYAKKIKKEKKWETNCLYMW